MSIQRVAKITCDRCKSIAHTTSVEYILPDGWANFKVPECVFYEEKGDLCSLCLKDFQEWWNKE